MSVKVAIIGAIGHVGYVLDGLGGVEDTVLSATAPGNEEEDISRLAADPKAAKYSPKVYDDWHRMLDEVKPDIVVPATFLYLNPVITLECLERGIHVFSEKPLAIDTETLEAIRKKQQESGRHIGMMLNYRYDPRYYTAMKLVQDGVIGEPASGYSQKSYKFGSRPEWYGKRDQFGGLIPWVGIHAIDWFQFVAGVDYKAVTAYHANLRSPEYPEMEDTATCLFELNNGGSAVMSFDFLRPIGAPTHGDDRLRLVGTKGALEISDLVGLNLTDADGSREVDIEEPERDLFPDFVHSMLTGDKCLISTEDTIEATRIALVTRESADKRQRLEF